MNSILEMDGSIMSGILLEVKTSRSRVLTNTAGNWHSFTNHTRKFIQMLNTYSEVDGYKMNSKESVAL